MHKTPLLLGYGLDALPAFPSSREEYERWRTWSTSFFEDHDEPLRPVDIDTLDTAQRARLHVAWRAILGHWAQGRSVAPDNGPLITHHFLLEALEAPATILATAASLVELYIDSGVTSTDALFLTAAFAWPLRETFPELSALAWEYTIHAPWQTDPLNLKDMILGIDATEGFRDGRTIPDLITARLHAGARASARAFLEGVALIQARREKIDRLKSYREFQTAEQVQGANEALIALAKLYQEEDEDQLHAREVMKRAAELTRDLELVGFIEDKTWDRSLDEAYVWSEHVAHPRQLDDEIEAALESKQPHHARRLAEALMVRKFNRLWYGSAIENLPGALDKFSRALHKGPPQDAVARRAAEHLATLYVRTHHTTQSARQFVANVAPNIAFTGRGAALHGMRDELEAFYNGSDPYHILSRDARALRHIAHELSDDERAASEEVERWFSDQFRLERPSTLDKLTRMLTSPLVDASRYLGDINVLEEACLSALRIMAERGHAIAGDLGHISQEAAIIRSQYGHGIKLMKFAREVSSVERTLAASVAMASSFLPPGLSLAAHAADLGSSLLLAFRAVARIGAVFGRDIHEAGGFQFVADAFAIGLSSKDGEGLLTYMNKPDGQLVSTVTIGAVTYSAARLVEYLWVAPRASGPRPSEQLLRHIARIVGFELTHTAAAKMVPLLGAILSGASTYHFISMITDAAIHVAARDALLVRYQSYDQS